MEQTGAMPEQTGASFLMRCHAVPLTAKEQTIRDYIKANSGEIIHMSIGEVAEQCGVSEASLVRFSKKLGFKGFQALKIFVAQDTIAPALQFYEEMSPDDTADSIARKVFRSYANTLNETLAVLDPQKAEAAAELIASARRVVFFALGGSENVAEDAVNKFLRIGIPAYAYTDANMQRMAAAMMGEGDTAVAISHSGATLSTIESLAIAKQNGARTVVITNHSRSPILEYGDVCLFTSARETLYRGESFASRIAQLTILDTLLTMIFREHDAECYENLQKTRRSLDATKV
ncbi:MurR/RpiR family transcriptional regulator [Pseudoflavonifractor sp. MSJ-37]|uniref:MurR/RpiR family transcriptional regulator n=1 Tax=Pseudoflavonifractor sp. MSJ-37 TaxID=2841531 RepID=UPI001C102D81|nr:MurR/RpiR family transcriptional regulator [Pseudoflavonifractor sp. MSJ-37]MBU5434091.1 MurR/RpiR family transcriptional regulator [Pseudoflavonifractor sp. MSJ-37]